jgi:hypothetical protein
MSLLQNSNAISSGGNDIYNSLRFRSSASAYLNRTPPTAGLNQTKTTLSFWIKRGTLGTGPFNIYGARNGAGATYTLLDFNADNLRFLDNQGATLSTTAVFRDPSAWYHVVLSYDTSQATASNRVSIYVNGTKQILSGTYPTLNAVLAINYYLMPQQIGQQNSFQFFDGYIAEFHNIDGQALTPSSFGETDTDTGSWKPKAYTGTYGTNGFSLKFSDIATTSGSNAGLGKDFSGNGNYFNTNNISVTAGTTYDAMIDSPTLTSATVANYCTLHPLPYYGGYNVLSRGNLQFTSGNSNWMRALATIAVSSGKWYWEITANNTLSQMHGISNVTNPSYYAGATNWVGYDATGYGYFSDDGAKWNNNGGVAYGATYDTGDIVGIAFDADNGKLYFSKNGTFQASGDPAAGTNAAFTGLTNGPYVPVVSVATTSGANTCDVNFGQRPFSYTPPTGFVRLNTYNLPDSTIKKGNTVMDATIYTGTGAARSVTNAGAFKPDLVWIKSRSAAFSNVLYDSIRGVANYLVSDSTAAQVTDANSMTAFNTNGFSVGSSAYVNGSSASLVGWQWQAGQGTNTSNTSGTITSTVSVNATAGFSVVTYTGTGAAATVGHGLGVAPKMIIVKSRSLGTEHWAVYHTSLGNTQYILLNLTNAASSAANLWNNTTPTSSVFSILTNSTVNTSAATYVAYCWAEIAGFSKFGSYTGNGSTDGPFVYLGFRPKFVLIKRTDSATNWYLFDTSRDTYNVMKNELLPNSTNAEADNTRHIDTLSNGFKIRNDNVGQINANGGTFIYMAFAENPFKNSNAR